MNSIDFINRLETSAGCKDVKYIIYREVWKWRQTRIFEDLYCSLNWNPVRCCWESNGYLAFNWRYWKDGKYSHYGVSKDRFIHSILNGSMPIRDKNTNTNQGIVMLPKNY